MDTVTGTYQPVAEEIASHVLAALLAMWATRQHVGSPMLGRARVRIEQGLCRGALRPCGTLSGV